MLYKLAKENPQLNLEMLKALYRANLIMAVVNIAQDLNKAFKPLKPDVYLFSYGDLVDITETVDVMLDAIMEKNTLLSDDAFNILRINSNLTPIRPNRYKAN